VGRHGLRAGGLGRTPARVGVNYTSAIAVFFYGAYALGMVGLPCPLIRQNLLNDPYRFEGNDPLLCS